MGRNLLSWGGGRVCRSLLRRKLQGWCRGLSTPVGLWLERERGGERERETEIENCPDNVSNRKKAHAEVITGA